MKIPELPRRLALLGASALAAPRLAAGQPISADNAMAEPHALATEQARAVPMPAGEQHPVAIWTRLLMGLTGGVVALRAQATLHLAMHDAANAAEPRFTRFRPPELDEPPAGAALAAPRLAMAAAAAVVLTGVHPSGASAAAPALASARGGFARHRRRRA